LYLFLTKATFELKVRNQLSSYPMDIAISRSVKLAEL